MKTIVSLGLFLALTHIHAADPSQVLTGTLHKDHRNTPKLQFTKFQGNANQTMEDLAWSFIVGNAANYEASNLLGELELYRVQESLLGTHFHFRQMINGLMVEGGEVIISISGNTVYKAYNNLFPLENASFLRMPDQVIDEATAFDAVWHDLTARGELLLEPKSELVLLPQGKSFRLVYKTFVALDDPYGDWVHYVDAGDASIVEAYDSRITRKPWHHEKRSGEASNRSEAFARFFAKQAFEQAQKAKPSQKRLATGSGVVFDPDPRTTLMDETIQDTDGDAVFVDAYFTRDLLDITEDNGTFSLTGPWIDIQDFDPPSDAPSTTADGNWTATRGDTSFNDAMTYFHIDQSQRYMQSLGFVDATGIQFGPIETDANGANGADNSFFRPGSNQMAFGHGCVDDNEDADVILHEYGHAINYSINSNWGGGDSGAIGEGFGDYWAGSYSISTLNGDIFQPEKVYTWDGHGSPQTCWPGRLLNRTDAQYDPGRSYGAHQTVGNFVSDELWSAPIFRALLELIDEGRSREEVDQIILEAQFGLGSGLTMRDLGQATVAAAIALYPDPMPHGDVFANAFADQNIIELPRVQIEEGSFQFQSGTGQNGVPDPGETVTLLIQTSNIGLLGATNVTATLTSSSNGVDIIQGMSAYPDMTNSNPVANATPFQVSLPGSAECGTVFNFSLALDFTAEGQASSTTLNLQMTTGAPTNFGNISSTPSLAIPDDNGTGVTDTIDLSGETGIVNENFSIDIDLTHTYQGDLLVRLMSPSGTEVVLHNRTGGSADNIQGNYPDTLSPAESLEAMAGESVTGVWELFISDNAGSDTGTLNSWTINFAGELACDNGSDPCLDFQVNDLGHAWRNESYYVDGYDRDNNQVINILDCVAMMNACGQSE